MLWTLVIGWSSCSWITSRGGASEYDISEGDGIMAYWSTHKEVLRHEEGWKCENFCLSPLCLPKTSSS